MKRLIGEAEIQAAVDRLGRKIADYYRGRPLTILGVLTGSMVLVSDLVRRIDLPLRVGLIQASSYRGRAAHPGALSINSSLVPDVEGRDVLLVDDIYDTGRTLSAVLSELERFAPASVRTAVLLFKEGRQDTTLDHADQACSAQRPAVVHAWSAAVLPDYYCFKIPDVFVVGYGLDYNDEYRHLPYVASLDAEDM